MKYVMYVFGFLALMFVLTFLLTGQDYAMFKFWAPKYENAKREVFENTQSYVQGKVEYLSKLQYQYQSASGDEKLALRQLILNEAATIDTEKLPLNLQIFIRQLRGGL